MSAPSVALAFEHADDLATLGGRLAQATGWQWHARENDRLGDYLWASLPAVGGVARLFAEKGRYILDLEWKSGDAAAQAAWRALLLDMRDRILPAAGAGGVQRVPAYGR